MNSSTESHNGSVDTLLLYRSLLDFSSDNAFSSNGWRLLKLSCTKWMALLCTREVPCNCSILTHTHTNTFVIHRTDTQNDLTGFGGFSAPLLLPMASSSTSWLQLFSFTPTIPNLKNPSLHFRRSTLALTLNNTLYHTLSTPTQPSHAHSPTPFTIPLHLQHIFTSPNISAETEVQMPAH